MASKRKSVDDRRKPKKSKAQLLYEKRSRAAKKGWDTRRLKEQNKLLAKKRSAKKVLGIKEKKKPSDKSKKGAKLKKENARLKQDNDALQKEIDGLKLLAKVKKEEEFFKDWPVTSARGIQYLHQDGTLAVSPSRLRFHIDAHHIRQHLLDLASSGHGPDSKRFYIESSNIAYNMEVDVQEVYTLFWSP